jgi:hypothetical protein
MFRRSLHERILSRNRLTRQPWDRRIPITSAPWGRRLRVEQLEDRRLLAITVTTLQDSVNFTDGQTSLREAIFAANLVAGADTIAFAAALTSGGPATLILTQGELAITDSLTIQGPGASLLTIDASGNDPTPTQNNGDGTRLFNVDNGDAANSINVSISGLTLTGGDVTGDGGAIRSVENLTIQNSTITGNSATGYVDHTYYFQGYPSPYVYSLPAVGGGVSNRQGALTVTGSTISNNSAFGYGGGISSRFGTASVATSTITGNSHGGIEAGGLSSAGSLSVTQSSISGNSGDGISVRGGFFSSWSYDDVSITDSTVQNNSNSGIWLNSRGDLTVTGSTVSGNGYQGINLSTYDLQGVGAISNCIISGNASTGVVASGNVAISDSTVDTNGSGGIIGYGSTSITRSTIQANVDAGIFNNYLMTVSDSTVLDNTGSGISNGGFNRPDGVLTVTNTNIDHNSQHGIRNYLGSVSVTNSTITGNSATSAGPGFYRFNGGGIYSIGTFEHPANVTVTGSTISVNSATGQGGAIWSRNGAVSLTDSVITGNQSTGGGGIYVRGRSVSLLRTTVRDNTAAGIGAMYGGGIKAMYGGVTITDSTITGNSTNGTASYDKGGGIYARGFSSYTVTISRSTISGNSADFGGGISCASLTMSGSTVSSNAGGGVRSYLATITDCTISGNTGIGINTSNGTISRTTISTNTADGVVSFSGLTVVSSTISSNLGRGIDSSGGTLTISDSTINGNSATVGGGIRSGGGTMIVSSSTISGNSSSTNSGGLYLINTASTIRHSTITSNTSGVFAGGLAVIGGSLQLDHTIVAGNNASLGRDLVGSLGATVGARYSLIGDNSNSGLAEAPVGSPDANGNLVGGATNGIINPQLGLLADNGGPTRTHVLLPGSPALNAGDPAAVAGSGTVPQYDQRGTPFVRVFGIRIDIGAFERQSLPNLNLVVDTLSDVLDGNYGPGQLSLREAIQLSNWSLDVPEVITFAAALTSGGPATIVLTNGELAIRDSVVVLGPGANLLTIDASGNDPTPTLDNGDGSRIFNIDDSMSQVVDVQLQGLKLTGGDAASSGGGAIRTRENLILSDSIVTGNNTTGSGGGISYGAVALTVTNSTITGNVARTGGGIAGGSSYFSSGMMTMTHTVVSGNSANDGGGGLSLNGKVTIDQSTISGNSAKSGGGIYARGAYNDVTIAHSTITGNVVGSRGRGGGIFVSGSLRIHDSTISGNAVVGRGGGIYVSGNATIERSTISGNTSTFVTGFGGFGGGICVTSGFATIRDSTITTNTAVNDGGGGIEIRYGSLVVERTTIGGNSATYGGGIRHVRGNLTVTECTISGNNASGTRGGGGIWTDTNLAGTQLTLIVNSTISGNTAANRGGGIYNVDGLTIVRFSTITGNSAASNSGGGVATWGDNVTRTQLLSSIVSANTNGDVHFFTGTVNSFVSLGYNLIGSGNAVPNFNHAGDQPNILNPMLAPLADNGGPTKTHLPLAGSAAINAGDPAAVGGVGAVPLFDQRGEPFARAFERIDIGAAEVQPPSLLSGDFDGNGSVDSADYVIWRMTDRTPIGYDTWRANFGNTAPAPPVDGIPLPNDPDTLLLARFDGTLAGEAGEIPTSAIGPTYTSGKVDQAMHVGSPGSVLYSTTSNINSLAGTVEFWIRPDWNGNEGRNHTFFKVGTSFGNSMLLSIDGANNLRFIQQGDNPATQTTEVNVERGVGTSGAYWIAGQWHHVAATWDSTTQQYALYIDGRLIDQRSDGVRISSFSTTSLAIGAETNGTLPAEAAFDEFRISNRARSAAEIAQSFASGRGPVQTVPPPDLAELNARNWTSWTQAGTGSLSDDFGRKIAGQSSVKFVTNGPFDTYVRYPGSLATEWNLGGTDTLAISFYAENPNLGFQEGSPTIRLYNIDGSYFQFQFFQNGNRQDPLNEARNTWKTFEIPLDAGPAVQDGWRRTTVGNPQLSAVTDLEIHADTWESGFTLWIDDVRFIAAPAAGTSEILSGMISSANPKAAEVVPVDAILLANAETDQVATESEVTIEERGAIGAAEAAQTLGDASIPGAPISELVEGVRARAGVAGGVYETASENGSPLLRQADSQLLATFLPPAISELRLEIPKSRTMGNDTQANALPKPLVPMRTRDDALLAWLVWPSDDRRSVDIDISACVNDLADSATMDEAIASLLEAPDGATAASDKLCPVLV